jgi:replication factor C small subunit
MAPTTLEEMCLPDRIVSSVKGGIYENLFFYGSAGIGKSQLAKVLTKDLNCLYINASIDGNIGELRSKMREFAMNRSVDFSNDEINSSAKVIFLDEIDGSSDQFFKGLRGFMDEFENVRYICTANYINKIPEPVQSRFSSFNFNLADSEVKEVQKKYAQRIAHIIKVTGMKVESKDEFKSSIGYLLKNEFPDFRNILQSLQGVYISGKTLCVQNLKNSILLSYSDLFDIIFSGDDSPESIHQLVMKKYQNDISGALNALSTSLIDYVMKNKVDHYDLIPHFIVKVCDYQSKLPVVIDQTVCLKACLYELQKLVNSK